MNKKILVLLVVMFMVLIGSACDTSTNSTETGTVNNNQSTEPQTSTTPTGDVNYYADDAKVMIFYSEYCGWCIKQKDVLAELGKEGYKVKPMDVGKDQNLWQQYNISGTPTFIAPDGTKLVGFQQKDALKAFLDKYK